MTYAINREQLKALVKAAGLNHYTLAVKAGVSSVTTARMMYQRGWRVYAYTAEAVARALDALIEDFVEE